jgi:AcrR family transcriptional regulator
MRSAKASTRRMGVENSEVRAQLIEAAARLLRKEGWAAVTAGRLAEVVGLKRQIVHYYFGTIDDLLIAVIRRESEAVLRRLTQALESEEPLRALWDLGSTITANINEFNAAASHRKSFRAEMKNYMNKFRRIQTEALSQHLKTRGIKLPVSPASAAIMISSLSYTLASEKAMGVTEGHAETRAIIEKWLQSVAPSARRPRRKSNPIPNK